MISEITAKAKSIIYYFLVFALVLVLYAEGKRIFIFYGDCKASRDVYRAFLSENVCSVSLLRHRYEKIGLVDCGRIKWELDFGSPMDCAFREWVYKGPIGFIVIDGVFYTFKALTSYVVVAILILVTLGIILGRRYMLWFRKPQYPSTLTRHNTLLEKPTVTELPD